MSSRDTEAAAAFAAGPWRPWLERLALAASGLAFSCPFVFKGFSLLGWIGLLPLLLIARVGSPWRGFRCGMLWGYFWSLGAFWWLREIELVVPFLLGGVLGLFPALWAAAVPALERNLLLPMATRLRGSGAVSSFTPSSPFACLLLAFSLSAWWCCLEWCRSWFLTGLPWNYLGATQWSNLPLIQICEFTGVYGVSFLLALANVSIALLLVWRRSLPAASPAIAAILLVALSVVAGRLSAASWAKELEDSLKSRIAVVQCDISQRRRASSEQAIEALDVCVSLSDGILSKSLLEKTPPERIDLVVWPETAVPYPLLGDPNSSFSAMYRYRLFDLIRAYKVPFLLGSLDYGEPQGLTGLRDVYNAALLVDTKPSVADSYRKEHIVPFGEFVPLGNSFPKLNKMIGMGRNLSRGGRFNPIEAAPGVRAGISICYEDVFPYISRRHVLNGANMLMVITNDAWYPKSSEPEQHFANAVFRAVETRLPMLRCGNSNFSCLISPEGRILDSVSKNPVSGAFEPERKLRAAAVFEVAVPKSHKLSFHTRFGDLFVALCFLISGAGAAMALLNWRDFKAELLKAFEGVPPGSAP